MIRLIELFQRPWALHEPYLLKAYEVIARHDAGIRLNAEQIEAATASQQARAVGAEDLTPAADTAVIQIRGVIAQHAEMVSNISGPRGTSVEGIRRQINAAVNAAGIERIVLDVSSPGGSADGIDELAEDIRAAGQIKPVIAYTDSRMASAAYWIAAAASEVYAARTAEVGSIGVYCVVHDLSVMAHNEGIKVHVVKAGSQKGAGFPGTQITQETLDTLQETVNEYYGFFTQAVSKLRSMPMEQVLQAADGRMYLAGKAQEKGLIDGIRTRAEIFAPRGANSKTGARSMSETTGATTASNQTTQQTTAAATPPAVPAVAPAAAATVDEAAIRAQERQRLAGLQVLDSDYPEQKALIEQCRNDGTSLRDAEHLVMSADRKLRRSELTELRSRGVASTLANGNEDVIASAGAFDEATVRARYASSKEMQERYGSADAAVRWERARAQVAAE